MAKVFDLFPRSTAIVVNRREDLVTASAARDATAITDGASLMVGGFMGVGTPERLIDALLTRGARGLT